MADCPEEPSVNNALISVENKTNTVIATYQCLSGFVLNGDQRIVCNRTNGTWPDAPRCTAMTSDIFVYVTNAMGEGANDDWWHYFLAVFLCLVFLTFLIVLIAICCIRFCEPPYCASCLRNDDRMMSDWMEASQPGTAREAPVFRSVRQAKEISHKQWIPHRNSIRNINTSTK